MLDVALIIATANEQLIELVLAKPLEKNRPEFYAKYAWLIVYVRLVTGAALSYISRVNLLDGTSSNQDVGLILTALVVGGGSEFVHQLFGALRRSDRNAP